MSSSSARLTSGLGHIRHSVAKWRTSLTLRARLSLLVALAIALVITALTQLQLKVVEQTIEDELAESARLTAEAIRADLRSRPSPFPGPDLHDWLYEFIESDPGGQVISVVAAECACDLIALGWSQELAQGRAPVVRATLARSRLPVLLVPVRVLGASAGAAPPATRSRPLSPATS